MYLVVGLGNPGSEYQNNRHNVGFMAADEIVRRFSLSEYKSKFNGLISAGEIAGEKIVVLKPMTYMNLSGNSVVQAALFYKILPDHILVFHDDLDLEPLDVRVKIGGGNGGHNGLKSLDAHMTNAYGRVRIGIGHPGVKDDVSHYVTSDFPKSMQNDLRNLIEKLTENIDIYVTKGLDAYKAKLGE